MQLHIKLVLPGYDINQGKRI